MTYSIYLALALATAGRRDSQGTPELNPDLPDVLEPAVDRIRQLVETLRQGSLSPLAAAGFEKDLQQATRELGRLAAQWAYNHLEPADAHDLPTEVHYEGSRFRRLTKKTPQQVSTLFGTITVRRLGYRAAPAEGEPVLFPLCRALGLVHGATPALLERVAHYQAESGATQKQTLERLRQEHGVRWGVKRLRQVTAFVAQAMEGHRAAAQAEQVLGWLEQAQASRGRHRPVLSVGRDGITLGLRLKGCTLYEVATTGTLTVYDRRGRRLGTVYLAYTPESGQGTMSVQLTALLKEVLQRWQGPLPRLSYVTDAGDHETAYYRNVLRRLRHPRTGQRLHWHWVVDFYHASGRVWTLAEALFGAGQRSWSWARKMQKLLVKPGGIGRLLHSAAALRGRVKPRGKRLADFRRAYRYLQARRQHLRYAEYRRVGLPIGSGVTEAACKTVYTQRLKLSGMRWQKAGAQTILTLRVILLSGIWDKVYERTLQTACDLQIETPEQLRPSASKNAA
jgi:alkylhydroperoxidase/carboxymuconolactone decarboxylase family protein YurZ